MSTGMKASSGTDFSINFSKKWDMSDAILKLNGSGEVFHVNKHLLAVYSPFFKQLFFCKEAKSEQEINVDPTTMLAILKYLHHIDRKVTIPCTKDQLYRLYQASVNYEIPLIRDLCMQQFDLLNQKELLEVLARVNLHEEKSELLKKMNIEDIEEVLKENSREVVFSAADVNVIMEKTAKKKLLQEVEKKTRCTRCPSTDVIKVMSGGQRMGSAYKCIHCANVFTERRVSFATNTIGNWQ